jgi:hypothetical protein
VTLEKIAQRQAANFNVSTRTIWRWYILFRKEGYAELADRPRRDRGLSRRFMNSPRLRGFVEKKYLEEGISCADIHRQLLHMWPRLRMEVVDKAPSYPTVRTFLTSLPLPVVFLARNGEAKFRKKYGKSYAAMRNAVNAFKFDRMIN